MNEAIQDSPKPETSVMSQLLGDRHFLTAAIILAVTWASWMLIVYAIGAVFHKKAVAWPAGVEVDPVEFRMLSLAEKFGPDNRFELAGDGELFQPRNGELFVTGEGEVLEGYEGKLYYKDRGGRHEFTGERSQLKRKSNDEPVLDGKPDGERTIDDEVREILAIGTPLDKSAHKDRKSTWYVSRTYIDRTKPKGSAYRLWRLDVTYYTGTMDKAPHFPERCLEAGGRVLGEQDNVDFKVPDAPEVWGEKPVTCRFVQYRNPQETSQPLRVQYYVFALNGYPESSWKTVRLTTHSIFGKYNYFAKIQFDSINPIRNSDESEKATAEFVKYMLPEVLKALPMPEDVERLESGGRQAEKNSN